MISYLLMHNRSSIQSCSNFGWPARARDAGPAPLEWGSLLGPGSPEAASRVLSEEKRHVAHGRFRFVPPTRSMYLPLFEPSMRHQGETFVSTGGAQKFHPHGACLLFQRRRGYETRQNPPYVRIRSKENTKAWKKL